MKRLLFLSACFLIVACGQNNSGKKELLKAWILEHETEIAFASDSLIRDYRNEHAESDWTSADLAITNSMSGVLGLLADKAGDTTNCVVLELTLFKDTLYKPRLFLVATDSKCLQKLSEIELKTDSTQNFVFGKSDVSLQ